MCLIFQPSKSPSASFKYSLLSVTPSWQSWSATEPSILRPVILEMALVIECNTTSASLLPLSPIGWLNLIPANIKGFSVVSSNA